VTVLDPATTYVDVDVEVGVDSVILPNTILSSATRIGERATVGPNCHLVATEVGDDAEVTNTVAKHAVIGPEATVGPFTYLRPGTVLERAAKAGGFVEMKKAHVGEGSKVPHLSYMGDVTIGKGVNVGAGTITCNYDGSSKHETVIEDGAFIGSDTMLVAPVRIGAGAFTGAASAIAEDVPADALGLERNRQRNIEGWAARFRERHENASDD
jgi:bifunctional UDP-N-acetylglucosamine pyrophosphorylase/glucosamine-1-phosphate N-acetyltransferase